MSLKALEGLGAKTTLTQLENTYDLWSGKYEEDMKVLGYPGPRRVANIVRDCIKNDEARILDMAAGTGLAGEELRKLGFKNIDASDMSCNILQKAKEKGVYDKIFRCRMGEEDIESGDNVYDAVTIVGCFSVPVNVNAFQELHRVLKVGGILVITFRPDVWTDDDIYGYRAALQQSPSWRAVSQSLEDFHGALNVDKNKEFSSKWFFVVFEKI